MSRPLILEAFDDASPPAADFADLSMPTPETDFPPMGEDPMGDLPMGGPEEEPQPKDSDAYERGYQAGWDDCERKAQETHQQVGAELARNVQELGFTYHEARAHVLGALEPLLTGMVRKVLPELAAETLGQSVVEELAAMAETAADTPVTILVSPQSHDMIAEFLSEATALPYKLVIEETLTEWQVFFRLGEHERQFDLGALIERIGDRLAAFSDQNQKVLKHG